MIEKMEWKWTFDFEFVQKWPILVNIVSGKAFDGDMARMWQTKVLMYSRSIFPPLALQKMKVYRCAVDIVSLSLNLSTKLLI